MNIQDIKVQKGESIQPAWERLVKWVDTLKVVPGEGVRVSETPKGTIITVVRERNRHDHPFRVSISDLFVTVREGTVSSMSPVLLDYEQKEWLPIVTTGSGGENKTPVMKLDLNKIKGDQFYINLRLVLDEVGTLVDGEKNLRIVQTEIDSGDGDGAYYFPIATGYLNKQRNAVSEVFQIVHHNINYIFQDGDGTGRVLFFAS